MQLAILLKTVRGLLLLILSGAVLAVGVFQETRSAENTSFTLAVIPDTQNYIDFRHQRAGGFELDSAELFIQQMRYVARHSVANGGDIVFLAAVGDVWQHQTLLIDPSHLKRGFRIEPDPILARNSKRTDQVLNIEIPYAVEGYRIVSKSGLPFGVAPGNHDYDAMWSAAGYPPNRDKKFSELSWTVEDLGMLHIGGLDNFRSVFGDQSEFFKNKPWYIASYNGGANSAQRFTAAGYDFLHLALEMQPGNAILAWVESVLAENPGLPTIITTHDYLNAAGERLPQPMLDMVQVDPEQHNSAQQLWVKLLRRHDQIFLVLSGHQLGQSYRVDANMKGNPVHQILADYQARGQAGFDAGRTGSLVGIGDGWLRLMHFNFANTPATITVKTYSTYFVKLSNEISQYASWYKAKENPEFSDSEFYAADDFVIILDGFRERFSRNQAAKSP